MVQLFEHLLVFPKPLEFLGNLKCPFVIDLSHLNLASITIPLLQGALLPHLGLLSLDPLLPPHVDIHNSGLIPLSAMGSPSSRIWSLLSFSKKIVLKGTFGPILCCIVRGFSGQIPVALNPLTMFFFVKTFLNAKLAH